MRHWIGINTRGHQTGDMRHINQEISIHRISNFPHSRPVNHPGIGGKTPDQHFGTVLFSQVRNDVVINQAGFLVDAILDSVE